MLQTGSIMTGAVSWCDPTSMSQRIYGLTGLSLLVDFFAALAPVTTLP